jgi:hypothetical protein
MQVMLKELQMNYLSKDKDSQKMFKKLNYAIHMLDNKRELFKINESNRLLQDDEEGEEKKHSEPALLKVQSMPSQPTQNKRNSSNYQRRHSL